MKRHGRRSDHSETRRCSCTARRAARVHAGARRARRGAVRADLDAGAVASGPLVRGSVVTATTGAWTDSPTTYMYVWQRDMGSGFATIPGATAATYTLTAADVSANVRALVTARNAGGTTLPAASNALGPVVAAPPVNAVPPSVTGTAARGSVLNAVAGTWAGVEQHLHATSGSATAAPGSPTSPARRPRPTRCTTADEGAKMRVHGHGRPTSTAASLPPSRSARSPRRRRSTAPSRPSPAPPKRGLTLTDQRRLLDRRRQHLHLPVAARRRLRLRRHRRRHQEHLRAGRRPTRGALSAPGSRRPTRTAPSSAFSLALGPVAAAPPVNTVVPAITGTRARTKPLTAATAPGPARATPTPTSGSATPAAASPDIAGATGAIYIADRATTSAPGPRRGDRDQRRRAPSRPYSAATVDGRHALPVQGAAPVASGTAADRPDRLARRRAPGPRRADLRLPVAARLRLRLRRHRRRDRRHLRAHRRRRGREGPRQGHRDQRRRLGRRLLERARPGARHAGQQRRSRRSPAR